MAAGVVGSIKKRTTGEEDVKICVHVATSKTALDVVVCALPTDVAYNRCAAACHFSVPPWLKSNVVHGFLLTASSVNKIIYT